MIPAASTIERTTNMVGEESIEMSIDTKSLRFLMTTLSNLYSNRELAVLRELSTNARDAMIAAGKGDEPIRISLPNGFKQTLVIKDTGIGMDIEDLRNTYSRYGASNKRESNDFNGVLGLGSKSPFTITDQYTVVAVKAGIKTTVIVSRSEAGGGTMEVLSQTPTTDPNGVEIQIPTKRGADFNSLAASFFKWWPAGSVLVDGREPDRFAGDKIDDKLYLDHEYSYNGKDIFVMGNVPYPLTERMSNLYRVVYFADNGEIDFVPSREALDYTPRTQAVIDRVKANADAQIRAQYEKQIADLGSLADAVKFFTARKDVLQYLNMKPTYNGYAFPINMYSPWHGIHHIRYRGHMAKQESTIYYSDAYKQEYNVVVAPVKKLSATMKDRLTKYALDNKLANKWYVVDAPINDYWLSGLNEVEWDDIKAVKLNHVSALKGVKRGPVAEYQVFNAGGWWDANVKLDVTKPIYYVGASDLKEDTVISLVKVVAPGAQIAKVYKVKQRIFDDTFPTAKHLFEAARDYLKAVYADLDSQDYADYQAIDGTNEWNQIKNYLIPHREDVLDTELLSEYDRISAMAPLAQRAQNAQWIRRHIPINMIPEMPDYDKTAQVDTLTKIKYPLFTFAANAWGMKPTSKQLIDYINFIWTNTNNKESK